VVPSVGRSEEHIEASAWDEDSSSDPDRRKLATLDSGVKAREADAKAFC
jgi:hypothetical protein